MQTDKEFLIEVAQGAAFGLLVMGLFVLFIWSLNELSPEVSPEERFKVVDSYGSCAVVRYTDSSNRYNYFLHCK
jgi:hypothetical protein